MRLPGSAHGFASTTGAFVLLLLLGAGDARAGEPGVRGAIPRAGTLAEASPAARDEARRRFDRGLSLYNAGDLAGALAEFRRAYQLTAHPVVLYNLALVYAGLGDSAEAVAALEQLQGPASRELGPERAERARRIHEEQSQRVGWLEVRTTPARARIRIDGIDVAETPAPPVRVTAGTHVIAISAPMHEPRHLSVTVAGRATEVVAVELIPLEAPLSRLLPVSPVPDVEVRANGVLVGRTPFVSEVALPPGEYELEFTRPGYVPVRRRVRLDAGSAGRLEVPMEPSAAGLSTGGTLVLSVSEDQAVVTIDGEPRVERSLRSRLPLGRHTVRVQRAGFFDVEREVWVRRGPQTLHVGLVPTAEYLREYVRGAQSARLWSYVVLASGALITASAGAYLVWNQGEKAEAERAFERAAAQVRQLPGGRCNSQLCEQRLELLVDRLDARRKRDVYGWLGVGGGVLAVGAGVFLFARTPAPDRYAPDPESDVFGSLRLGAGVSSVELSGAF